MLRVYLLFNHPYGASDMLSRALKVTDSLTESSSFGRCHQVDDTQNAALNGNNHY